MVSIDRIIEVCLETKRINSKAEITIWGNRKE